MSPLRGLSGLTPRPPAAPRVRRLAIAERAPQPDGSADAAPAADRPPISAYIRTLNEERQIAEVVTAALQAAREVVIVDSGSTDATCALAEAAGARVYAQSWLGNGGQKRAAEERCVHDWLLDLDADEIVTPGLAAEIRALFAAGEPPLSAYRLTLVTEPPIGPAWEGFALDPRAKLYDRRRHRMPDSKAWDQLELPRDLAVGALRGALMHRSFADFAQYMAKWNRVSSARASHARLKTKWDLIARILFAPPVYFLRHYLLRGLWRAGLYGFCIACGVAFGRWMRDVKMYERHRGLHGGPDGGPNGGAGEGAGDGAGEKIDRGSASDAPHGPI